MKLGLIQTLKDRQLKAKIKNKDQLVFEDFYNKNIDDIYRFIYFKVGTKEDASDLSSLSFLKTWEYVQKNPISKQKESLKALLYKIARNVVIDYYRKNKKDNISIDAEDFHLDIKDDNIDIEMETSNKIDYEILTTKMMELKNEYREVIVMRYVNELSLEEIAEISGKSKINARVLLHRATKALKDIMGEK